MNSSTQRIWPVPTKSKTGPEVQLQELIIKKTSKPSGVESRVADCGWSPGRSGLVAAVQMGNEARARASL
ncbi:unnamed protein product [Leptosia nina]|uniref:Uncharacterized protein n=1 Tax=Leptosia nina TaxID=320188 RepID=A0AAV1IUM2_9NEOP